MSSRLKLTFLTILTLIIINCGNVFASSLTGKQVQQIMDNMSQYKPVFSDSTLNIINEKSNEYTYAIVLNYGITYFSNTMPEMLLSSGYLQIHGFNGYVLEFNSQTGAITISKTINGIYFRLDDSDKYIFLPDGAINKTGNSNYDFYPGWQSKELISLYNQPYFNFSLNYKGNTIIGSNNQKVNAYDFTYLNTGITTVGKKYLILGDLYIDQNYLIDNLFTIAPIMTKYNLQMSESWQYTLYESLYTIADEEAENGYKRYELRIPYEYISTPNYYNIYFESKETDIQSDFNINFVLLNHTETNNGVGEIITPSGEVISGDAIEDNTTLGDINNTIGGIGDKIDNLGDKISNNIENTILGTENESGERTGGLLGGILDGIKGLFIPDAEYFGNYFTELNDWFSARLGLLYFPIDLLFEFFERVIAIDFNDQTLSIGPYTMPLNDDFELVPKIDFDFKTFVENEDIKGVYDTYLIIVDGLIIFGLSQLIRIKYEEVFGK